MQKISSILLISLFIATLSCSYDQKDPEPVSACPSEVSFTATIEPMIRQNCSINGCHNGSIDPDLTSYAQIFANKDRIHIQTSQRTMPLGRTLTQSQIEAIECWVQQGAPNN